MTDVYFSLYAARNYQLKEDKNHTICCSKEAADLIVKQPNPEKTLLDALNQCDWNVPQLDDVVVVLTA
jgi:hypothetical protein